LELEADCSAIALCVQAEPPWLDVDAAIPEAIVGRSDSDVNGAGDVEAGEVVAGGDMRDVYRLAVDGDGEGCRLHLGGDGNGLDAGRCECGWHRQEQQHEKQRARSGQEGKPRKQVECNHSSIGMLGEPMTFQRSSSSFE